MIDGAGKITRARIELPEDELGRFCRRHRIRSLALFGSVSRDDFGAESDVGVLVEFEPEGVIWEVSEAMDRIVVNPRVHFGKPCVAGTRITVQNVLELLDEGLAFQEIIQDYYPALTVEDIRACVRYAIALVAAEDIHLAAVPA